MNAKNFGIETFWFPFVVWVVLISHVWVGFGCMQVNVPCGEQKKHNALAKIKSLNPSAIIWPRFSFLFAFLKNLSEFTSDCVQRQVHNRASLVCYPWSQWKPQKRPYGQVTADGFQDLSCWSPDVTAIFPDMALSQEQLMMQDVSLVIQYFHGVSSKANLQPIQQQNQSDVQWSWTFGGPCRTSGTPGQKAKRRY